MVSWLSLENKAITIRTQIIGESLRIQKYYVYPTEGCGPSRLLQLAGVKFEEGMNICPLAVMLCSC